MQRRTACRSWIWAGWLLPISCMGRIPDSPGSGAAPGTASESRPAGPEAAAGPPAGGAPAAESPMGAGPVANAPAASACVARAVGPAPLRRLSHREYDNTIRDLFGTALQPARQFAPDAVQLGFDNGAALLTVSQALSEDYLQAAGQVASEAVKNLARLLPCDPAKAGEDACARQFLAGYLPRVFRRPVTAAEQDAFYAVYQTGKARGFSNGIRLAITASLAMPSFLYHWEHGNPTAAPSAVAGAVPLASQELANRLSYFLWGSMPDDALSARAARGGLRTKEDVLAEAERMLDDPKAMSTINDFHEQWLETRAIGEVEKDSNVYKDFAGLRASMAQESRLFIEKAVLGPGGSLASLLASPSSFVDQKLAAFYGVAAPSADGFARVELDPTQRAGVLTLPGVMAVQAAMNRSDPIRRGKFVREQLLCQTLPSPPGDLDVKPPEPSPDATTRQRFEEHRNDPSCAGCHRLIDSIGFGFEHYDGMGRWRQTEASLPVDASGEVAGSLDSDGPFTGAVELAGRLAKSGQVRDCVVNQWFRYARGRLETDADACDIERLKQAFSANGSSPRTLLLAMTQVDGFLIRNAAPMEVRP
jgi:hypothetical protein